MRNSWQGGSQFLIIPSKKKYKIETMAPNLNNVAILELPVAAEALQNTIQFKFLPLTDPREQGQFLEQQQKLESETAAEEYSVSYWDWTANTPEEKVQKKHDLFSVSHIESNMINDAQKAAYSSPWQQLAAHDDYWAEHSEATDEEKDLSTKPQHKSDGYWYWAVNRNIHAEHMAERLTSTSRIESQLLPRVQAGSSVRNDKHDSYWTWQDTVIRQQLDQNPIQDYWKWNTLSMDDEKQHLIQSLLEYDAARQLFTADHIEKQLVAHASRVQRGQEVVFAAGAINSSAYWYW
jgi:hypothetical protein